MVSSSGGFHRFLAVVAKSEKFRALAAEDQRSLASEAEGICFSDNIRDCGSGSSDRTEASPLTLTSVANILSTAVIQASSGEDSRW